MKSSTSSSPERSSPRRRANTPVAIAIIAETSEVPRKNDMVHTMPIEIATGIIILVTP